MQIALGGAAVAQTIIPAPPQLNASSYMLVDHHSGKVIVERDIDKKLPSASLTKIMTVYVAADVLRSGGIRLDDEVLISEKAWRMTGSKNVY